MHTPQHIAVISTELGIPSRQVEAVAELLSQEATVPFIARYRKEATGSLDEVQITAVRDRLGQLAELDRRVRHWSGQPRPADDMTTLWLDLPRRPEVSP